MPRAKLAGNLSLLGAALTGLEAQKQRLEGQIQQVRALLGKRRGRPPGRAKPSGKRQLSAAARKRISLAQRRRWAAYRQRQPGAK
jgi:hypothetical protein